MVTEPFALLNASVSLRGERRAAGADASLELTAPLTNRTVSNIYALHTTDGKSGKVLDLGPWPASPFVASYAAADGWRAAAVTASSTDAMLTGAGGSVRPRRA